MKIIPSTPVILTTADQSSALAKQINQTARDMGSAPDTTSAQSPRVNSDETIESISANNPATLRESKLTPEEEAAADKFIADYWVFLEKQKTSADDMIKQTEKVFSEIAQERPSLLNQEFDFTHNGKELEVVEHNLSDRDYSHLKAKLNGNKKLLEAMDVLNLGLVDRKNSTWGNEIEYTKEDAFGRIHVREVIEQAQAQTALALRANYVYKPNEEVYYPEAHLNAFDIMMNTSMGIRTTA